MTSIRIFLFVTISGLLLISSTYATSPIEIDHTKDRLKKLDIVPNQDKLHSKSEPKSHPSYQLELSKNIYSIYLSNGGKYKVFEDLQAVGQCILEWKLFQNKRLYEYLITIRSKDGSVRLYSDNGEILEIELFDGINSSSPINLFNLQNFYEAAIAVRVENNATIMRYPIQVVIPPRQWISPGTYKCFLDVGVYTGNGREINTQTIQLSVEVDSSQKILIKSRESSTPQSSVTLDFGEVYTTATKSVILQVESNISYHLSVQSINSSKLMLTPNWNRNFYQCSSILYDCSCDGFKFFLHNTPQKILSSQANKKGNNTHHCFSITIFPDARKNWEGVYEDEILFSLQPIY